MDPIAELLAIEAIKRLKARYFRLLDTKQFDAWGELFTEHATLKVDVGITTWGEDPMTSETLIGRKAIVAQAAKVLPDSLTVHHGHMPEIEVRSPDEATGIWALGDIVHSRAVLRSGAGHYHETYRRIGGRWLIATLHLKRLLREEIIRTPPSSR